MKRILGSIMLIGAFLLLIPLSPFLITIELIKKIINYKYDMRLKGFAFVFKNRNEIKYYENNNELFKSPIGIYTTGREPEITLFSDIEWKEKVQEFIKDRKTELIQKIQDDKEISKWYQINI